MHIIQAAGQTSHLKSTVTFLASAKRYFLHTGNSCNFFILHNNFNFTLYPLSIIKKKRQNFLLYNCGQLEGNIVPIACSLLPMPIAMRKSRSDVELYNKYIIAIPRVGQYGEIFRS